MDEQQQLLERFLEWMYRRREEGAVIADEVDIMTLSEAKQVAIEYLSLRNKGLEP
jgi:hypothetical protein